MKPRIMFSNGTMRVATNRGIWRRVNGPEGGEPVVRAIVRAFGESLVRREKAMRKARRGRR